MTIPTVNIALLADVVNDLIGSIVIKSSVDLVTGIVMAIEDVQMVLYAEKIIF